MRVKRAFKHVECFTVSETY